MDHRDREKGKKRKHRSRSRSREPRSGRDHREHRRERSHSRDRDRNRERKRKQHRSRSRSRERHGQRSDGKKESAGGGDGGSGIGRHKDSSTGSGSTGASRREEENRKRTVAPSAPKMSMEEREQQRVAEQAQLDEEMQRRRERVRAWQEARAKEKGIIEGAKQQAAMISPSGSTELARSEGANATTGDDVHVDVGSGLADAGVTTPSQQQQQPKVWSLEDEDEDGEGTAGVGVAQEPAEAAVPPTQSSQDEQRPAQPPVTAPHEETVTAVVTVEDDVDPLDDFMASLYSAGGVAAAGSRRLDGGDEDDGSSSSHNEYFDGVNQYVASNVITLDQLMGSSSADPYSRRHQSEPYTWESDRDTAPGSPETADEDEEKEERERQEFLNAIRRLREKEETSGTAQDLDLGVVYAEDGDVMDELESEQKKKTALELLDEAKKGKELKAVDHAAVQYIPFRKNLFIVPRALSKLNDQEVKARRDDLQIKVRGKGCPPPVETWEQCGLSDRALQVLEKHALAAPFPIQRQAIPAIMCGRDVIGVAKTGSGKTLAFLLPMMRHIQDQPPLKDGEGPVGLIMAPARELAFQIFNEAKRLGKSLGLRVACVYGGAGVAEQIGELKRGAEMVVCTPGRMIDILCMQAGKLMSLRRVTMVVLDEADRMFDMGFEPQIRMILNTVRPDRQTVLFSATFPRQIERLARSILKLPLEIVVGERSTVNKDITQYVEVHEEEDKFMRLLQLLGIWYERGNVLIFVDKQEKCDQLFQDLLRAGYPSLSLHGGKDQLDRDYTLHEFKALIKTVMVATSVAGRGLDVPEIVCVINYNCPNHLEDYVHRVGRTGRAGRKGTAYTFLAPNEDQYAHIMTKALEHASAEIPRELKFLSDQFKAKVARGDAKWVSSGFVGKGFTFEADEMNEGQKAASLQRRAYEIEQGIQEEREEEEDLLDEELFDEGHDAVVMPPVESGAAAVAADAMAAAGPEAVKTAVSTKAITVEPFPPVPAGIVDTQAALARAKQLAAQMVSKSAPPVAEARGPGHFADELEINDYPAAARKKVTHRSVMDDIAERTGVNVISRGVFIEPGKTPKLGERKLFLLLEGTTEMQVRQAKLEVIRQLEEETLKLGAGIAAGRYSVV